MKKALLTEEQLRFYYHGIGVRFETDKEFMEYLAVHANWYTIAKHFGLTYRYVVRWYRETFMRRRQNQISAQDREFIYYEMTKQLHYQGRLDHDFRNYLKSNLSDTYNECAFMTYYYNCKNKLLRCIESKTFCFLPDYIVFESE